MQVIRFSNKKESLFDNILIEKLSITGIQLVRYKRLLEKLNYGFKLRNKRRDRVIETTRKYIRRNSIEYHIAVYKGSRDEYEELIDEKRVNNQSDAVKYHLSALMMLENDLMIK